MNNLIIKSYQKQIGEVTNQEEKNFIATCLHKYVRTLSIDEKESTE